MAKKKKNIIIKKIKKVSGGGHHGGAWKVAYADFVTAMMAFFLLLWLLSVSSEPTLQGVAEYFTPTEAISDKAGLGFDGGSEANIEDGNATKSQTASSLIYGAPTKAHRIDAANKPSNIADSDQDNLLTIMNNISNDPLVQHYSDNISMDMTSEGLRIQIMDSENRPVFKPNTAMLQPYMETLLKVIGKMIKNQPNYISVSGHTASVRNYEEEDGIDTWELSTERANRVRKFLSGKILQEYQIIRIVGRADKEPFNPADPYGPKNIRVAITLLNADAISVHERAIPADEL